MKKGSCLIVGGGPGLGLALAKKFGTEGFDIGVITKRPPVLEAMEDALKPLGIRFTPLAGDLADFAALAKAIDEFVEKRGVPSVLIYNAAGYGDGNALAQNPEGLMHDLRVSVGAFVVAYQKLFEAMSLAGGSILVTGGGIAYQPSFDYLSLGVGKTAIDYVVNSIAPALSKRNIHVAIVTIKGGIKEGTHFSPDKIAQVYWQLHQEPVGSFTVRLDYS